MKALTKEEKFLLFVYQAALAKGEWDAEIDRYSFNQKLGGMHERGIDTICNQMAQANFIKKRGPRNVSITENGRRLIESF